MLPSAAPRRRRHCLKRARLHRPQHVQHFGRNVLGRLRRQGGGAAVELVGEQIILRNHFWGYAQRVQQQGGGPAGAVFARSAVKDQGRSSSSSRANQRANTGADSTTRPR